MDDEFDDENDTEERVNAALNSIDPTGELASPKKIHILTRIINDADAFAAGMYHGGHTGQEIMIFANRLYMIGYLIHTNNVIRALRHDPKDLDPARDDIWSYH